MTKLFYNRAFKLAELMVVIAIISILALAAHLQPIRSAEAATPNVAVGSADVIVIPLHITGTISATVAGIAKFNMPMPCDLIGVGTSAQAIVGATNTIDVKLGGVSVLSAPITIAAAATYTEGTITTSAITDEGAITVDVNIVGTSLTHVTVLLTCVRK